MFTSRFEFRDYMKSFFSDRGEEFLQYLESHNKRLFKSYEIIKSYENIFEKEVFLDLGSLAGLFLPAVKAICSFDKIYAIDYGHQPPQDAELKSATDSISYRNFFLNLEKERLPFDDNSVDVAIFFEILEHLLYDPMHILIEINRVLKPNGFLFISTPNLNSARAFSRMLEGKNPNLHTPYTHPEAVYARHNREYTIKEVKFLVKNAGFAVEEVATHPLGNKVNNLVFILSVLKSLRISQIGKNELGEFIYVVCKKEKHLTLDDIDTKNRFPEPIYLA